MGLHAIRLQPRAQPGAVRWSVVRGTVLWLVSVGPRRGYKRFVLPSCGAAAPGGAQTCHQHAWPCGTLLRGSRPCALLPGSLVAEGAVGEAGPGLGAGQGLLLSHCAQLCLGFSSGETFCSPVLLHSVSQVSLVPLTGAEEQTQVGLEAPLEISGATACSEQGHLGK